MTFCDNCGLLLPADADRCPRCGAPAPAPFAGPGPEPAAAGPRYHGAAAPEPGSLTTGGYLLYLCLFSIPLIGFVIALVFAFRHGGDPARKRFARAMALFLLIVAGVLAVLYVIAALTTLRVMGPFNSGPWM